MWPLFYGETKMAEKKEAKPQMIQAVYGRMVDPHTGLSFDTKPCELFKMTPWIQGQIDAGKLKLL